MRNRLEGVQIAALWWGRWRLFRKLLTAICDLSGWLLVWRLRSLPVVDSLLMRGSRVSGCFVPGLSDLDFEVILRQSYPPQAVVGAVRDIHQHAALLRRLFPWLQSPFIRSPDEWRQARDVPHEWLTHSRWRRLAGPLRVDAVQLDTRQHALALFRLCLRELTKTVPSALFRTPPETVLSTARFNPDRLQVLGDLSALLQVPLPNLQAWSALQNELESRNFLTRAARSRLALHLAYQYHAMDALTDAMLALGAESADPFVLGPQAQAMPFDWLQDDWLLDCLPPGFELLHSSGGCRYSQRKLYLLPPAGIDPNSLATALLALVKVWQEHTDGHRLDFHTNYASPIILPRKMLPLVHLGFGSCFEGFCLRQIGAIAGRLPFQREAFARELVDGVFVLRKKVGLLPHRPDRLVRYLQDYFVGVYPGLALALRSGEVFTDPSQAATRFCQGERQGDYQRRLAEYLGPNLYTVSRHEIARDPLAHLQLLEEFHRQLAG